MNWYWFSQRGLEESEFIRPPWYRRFWYRLTGRKPPVLWMSNIVTARGEPIYMSDSVVEGYFPHKPMKFKWSKAQDPDSWNVK